MSDRIAVMDEGVVQQFGPPEEIYETPRKTFVAGFIGVSNLLPGTVEGDGVRLSTGQLVRRGATEDCEQGPRCTARCARRRSSSAIDDRGRHGLGRGEIVERIYLGTTTQVIIELAPDVRVISVEQNTDRSRADDRWEIGQRIKLGGIRSTPWCSVSRRALRRVRPRSASTGPVGPPHPHRPGDIKVRTRAEEPAMAGTTDARRRSRTRPRCTSAPGTGDRPYFEATLRAGARRTTSTTTPTSRPTTTTRSPSTAPAREASPCGTSGSSTSSRSRAPTRSSSPTCSPAAT